MIKVYTTPSCSQCHACMEWLDSLGVEYEAVNAIRYTDPFTGEVKNADIHVVPTIDINGIRIEGFRRDRIKEELEKMPQ